MHEVKKPKKPLVFYYIIVLAALLLINFLFVPWAAERQVKEVGYDTFMDMTAERRSDRCRSISRIMRSYLRIRTIRRSIKQVWWMTRG